MACGSFAVLLSLSLPPCPASSGAMAGQLRRCSARPGVRLPRIPLPRVPWEQARVSMCMSVCACVLFSGTPAP